MKIFYSRIFSDELDDLVVTDITKNATSIVTNVIAKPDSTVENRS